MKASKKYFLFTKDGDNMHDSYKTLDKAKEAADKTGGKTQVCTEYIAPSPWDGKPSIHLSTVYQSS